MDKIRIYRETSKATADCVRILNKYKQSDWKRTAKFSLTTTSFGTKHTVRVFSDGTETHTLISAGRETKLCINANLNEHKSLIDRINELSKKYYTHDYGDVWFNPYTMSVWVSGGDGGITYSEEDPKVVAAKFENGDVADEAPYFHEKISELEDSTFEAEASPEEEEGYIQIGFINDICALEDEDPEGRAMSMDAGRELGDLSDKSNRLRAMSTNELKDLLKRYENDENYEKCGEILREIESRKKP